MKVSNKKDPTKTGNVIADRYEWAVGIGLIKKIKILDSIFGTARWEPAKDWEVIEGEGDTT